MQRYGNLVYPTLKDSAQYDVVEPKICEEPGCGKNFMRVIKSGSRACGQCQAKSLAAQEKQARENAILKAQSLSPKIQ